MEIMLLVVIVLLVAFIFYQDYANRKEREGLELKLMSQDVTEYKNVVEKTPPLKKEEPEEHLDLEDVPTSTLLSAKDKL